MLGITAWENRIGSVSQRDLNRMTIFGTWQSATEYENGQNKVGNNVPDVRKGKKDKKKEANASRK